MLGKVALVGGAALAGLRGEGVYAACGASNCSSTGAQYCPSNDQDLYIGCCRSGSQYYETRGCYFDSGHGLQLECTYSFATTYNCPNVPAP